MPLGLQKLFPDGKAAQSKTRTDQESWGLEPLEPGVCGSRACNWSIILCPVFGLRTAKSTASNFREDHCSTGNFSGDCLWFWPQAVKNSDYLAYWTFGRPYHSWPVILVTQPQRGLAVCTLGTASAGFMVEGTSSLPWSKVFIFVHEISRWTPISGISLRKQISFPTVGCFSVDPNPLWKWKREGDRLTSQIHNTKMEPTQPCIFSLDRLIINCTFLLLDKLSFEPPALRDYFSFFSLQVLKLKTPNLRSGGNFLFPTFTPLTLQFPPGKTLFGLILGLKRPTLMGTPDWVNNREVGESLPDNEPIAQNSAKLLLPPYLLPRWQSKTGGRILQKGGCRCITQSHIIVKEGPLPLVIVLTFLFLGKNCLPITIHEYP